MNSQVGIINGNISGVWQNSGSDDNWDSENDLVDDVIGKFPKDLKNSLPGDDNWDSDYDDVMQSDENTHKGKRCTPEEINNSWDSDDDDVRDVIEEIPQLKIAAPKKSSKCTEIRDIEDEGTVNVKGDIKASSSDCFNNNRGSDSTQTNEYNFPTDCVSDHTGALGKSVHQEISEGDSDLEADIVENYITSEEEEDIQDNISDSTTSNKQSNTQENNLGDSGYSGSDVRRKKKKVPTATLR